MHHGNNIIVIIKESFKEPIQKSITILHLIPHYSKKYISSIH